MTYPVMTFADEGLSLAHSVQCSGSHFEKIIKKPCGSKGGVRRSRCVVAGCSAEELQGSVEAIGKKVWKEMKSEELQLNHEIVQDIAWNRCMQ